MRERILIIIIGIFCLNYPLKAEICIGNYSNAFHINDNCSLRADFFNYNNVTNLETLNPSAPTGASIQYFCEVNHPTISELVASGTNIQWYETNISITPLDPANALLNGEDYFATQTIAGVESPNRLQVLVQIDDPGTPTGDNVQTLCLVNAPKIGDLIAIGNNIQWYSTSTSTNALNPNVALVSGDDYYATQTDGGCESDVRLQVVPIIDDPSSPTGQVVQSFCEIDNPTVDDLIAVGTNIQWYVDAVSTSPLLSFVALEEGEDYFATQTVNGCESSTRLQIVVTLQDPPPPTSADLFPTYCQSETPTIGDLVVTGMNVQWYPSLTSTSPLLLGVQLANGEDYFATQTINGCESTSRLQIIVAFENPDAPTAPSGNNFLSFCSIDNPLVGNLEAVGLAIQWYDDINGIFPLDPMTPLVDGEDYYATQTENGCESNNRLEVNIIIYDTTEPTTTNTNQFFCSIDNPTIADLDILGTGVLWYDDDVSNIPLDITDPLINGEDYYATQNLNGCESINRLLINVTVIDPPSPTTSSTIQSFCSIDNPSIADLDILGNGIIWYDDANSTIALSTTTTLVDGEDYYATQNIGSCESPNRLQINVEVEDPAAPTTASINQIFCASDNPTLSDVSILGTGISWYADANSNILLPSSSILLDGEDYYATQEVNGCESIFRLQINITLDSPSTPITSNASPSFCASQTPTIDDLSAVGNSITWYESSNSDIALPSTFALVDGEDYYATQEINGCESDMRLQVDVSIIDVPNNTLVATPQDLSICEGGTTNIQIFNSELDVAYQLIDVNTNMIIGVPVNGTGGTILLPTNILTSTAFFQVGCTSTLITNCETTLISQATVVVDPLPTAAVAGLNQIICNDTEGILEGSFPNVGTGTWTQISGPNTAIIDNPNANDSGISNLITGTYTFQWEIGNGACSGLLASVDVVEIEVVNITTTTSTTIVSTVGGNNGVIGICLEGGADPYTILWTPDTEGTLTSEVSALCSNYYEIVGLSAGIYEIGIVDDDGCASIVSNVSIQDPDCSSFEITNVSSANENCNENNDGTITIETQNGVGDITFDIGNGLVSSTSNSSSYTFMNVEAGDYTITVTDERLCSYTYAQTLTITQPSPLIETNTIIQPSIIGASDGMICITPEGGVGPYTLTSSCGTVIVGASTCGGTFYIENLPAGNCMISILDDNGCLLEVPVEILDPICDDFTIANVFSEDASCNGNTEGSIEISLNNGIPPFQYSIDGGNNFITDNSNIYLFDNLNAGTYEVEIIDNAGCNLVYSDDVIINEPPILEVDLTEVQNDCFDREEGSIVASVIGGSPDYSYEWSDGGSSSINNNLGVGTYSLTVTDVNGCTTTGIQTIINSPEFNMEIQTNGSLVTEVDINEGGSIDLEVLTDATNPIYAWTPNTGLSSPSSASVTASPLETTDYRVIVSSEEGCTDERVVRVNVITDYKIVIPNTFSPNGDSNNDDFYPIILGLVTINDFKIYNRWGQLIYDNQAPWNGEYQGKEQPVDTYVYVINYETPDDPSITVSGDILLVR